MSLAAVIDEELSIAIDIRRLSKVYKLYPSKNARVAEALDLRRRPLHSELRALDDVTLQIPRGATLGILGVNGSGKSTLLQIICSIIEPTSGAIGVGGRIAALIELGAGFNPHLTGRENVSVNSTILGLTQKEIDARMPLVEAFAEVGEFFDQPVRIYSSGMLMRVAFAMAIHVDPDILIIDEALAVGDARFQQKCFRRFRDFQAAGKTILFVTHDRFSVPRLCTHGAVLHHGKLVYFGHPKDAADCYSRILIDGDPSKAVEPIVPVLTLETGSDSQPAVAGNADVEAAAVPLDVGARVAGFFAERSSEDRCRLNANYNAGTHRLGSGGAAIIDYLLIAGGQANPTHMTSGDTLTILVRVLFNRDCAAPIAGFTIATKDGVLVFETNSLWLGKSPSPRQKGDLAVYRFEVVLNLGANDWFVDLAVAESQTEMLDARVGLLHFRCDPRVPGHGLATLPTVFSE